MRVLIITNLFPPSFLGGYELLCKQVCDTLYSLGHDISVLTSDHGVVPDSQPEVQPYQIARTLRLAVPFGQQVRHYPWAHRATMEANKATTQAFIRSACPDIIFLWSQLRLTVGPARAAIQSKRPATWTFNDRNILSHSPRIKGLRGIARWFLSNCLFPETTLRGITFDWSTAISQQLKDDLLAEGLPAHNCRVIYQGIPIDDYPLKENPGRLGQPLKLLYTGQLHEYKGIHTLLTAAREIGSRGYPVQVTVAGEGDAGYVARLKEQARADGLKVDFAGRVPRERLVAIYQSHDIFVFPSIWKEPFGLTHLEAMACGTPVISTANGGQGEFLRDGRNALVFKEADANSLEACIQKLITDRELAERISREARVTVETGYTLERYVKELLGFLELARSGS